MIIFLERITATKTFAVSGRFLWRRVYNKLANMNWRAGISYQVHTHVRSNDLMNIQQTSCPLAGATWRTPLLIISGFVSLIVVAQCKERNWKTSSRGPGGPLNMHWGFSPSLYTSLFTSCVYVDVAEKLCLIASIICTGTDNVSIPRFIPSRAECPVPQALFTITRYELI